MKRLLPLLFILAPAALAEGCDEADPCAWTIDVEPGFIDSSIQNATTGDWFLIELFSYHDENVTVTIGDHGTVVVQSYDFADFGPVQIGDQNFVIYDGLGTEITVNVFAGDFIEPTGTSEAEGESKDTPAPLGILPILGLLALRRK